MKLEVKRKYILESTCSLHTKSRGIYPFCSKGYIPQKGDLVNWFGKCSITVVTVILLLFYYFYVFSIIYLFQIIKKQLFLKQLIAI